AIAEADLLLGLGGVLVLADGDEPAVLFDQAAVAGGIGRAEADDDDSCTLCELLAGCKQRLGLNQRRVAEHDKDVFITARDRRAGGEHSVGCPEPFLLHEDLRRRIEAASSLADILGAM